MKRRLLKLGLLLLAGALINIAVAWGCALRPPASSYDMFDGLDVRTFSAGNRHISIRTGEIFASQHIQGKPTNRAVLYLDLSTPLSDQEFAAMIPSWSAFSHEDPIMRYIANLRPDDRFITFVERSTGWPLLTLRATRTTRANDQLRIIDHRDEIPLPQRWVDDDRIAMPIIPIWPGFAINTLFYSAILWLLFLAPFQLRRWRRTRRNLCPACAYPVGSSPICTECGRPVRIRSSRTTAE